MNSSKETTYWHVFLSSRSFSQYSAFYAIKKAFLKRIICFILMFLIMYVLSWTNGQRNMRYSNLIIILKPVLTTEIETNFSLFGYFYILRWFFPLFKPILALSKYITISTFISAHPWGSIDGVLSASHFQFLLLYKKMSQTKVACYELKGGKICTFS